MRRIAAPLVCLSLLMALLPACERQGYIGLMVRGNRR